MGPLEKWTRKAQLAQLMMIAGALCAAIACASFSGCTKKALPMDQDPRFEAKGDVEVELRVKKVELGAELSFFLAIARPDLEWSGGQGSSPQRPAALKPRLMYVSAVEDESPKSGRMCDRPRYPHKCAADISSEGGATQRHRVKILFEDQQYATAVVEVPLPDPLPEAEIIAPSAAPTQGSALTLSFRDVGADSYSVRVARCRPYENDGVNPCLDEDEYELVRSETGALRLAPRPGAQSDATVSTEGEVVRIDSAKRRVTFETSVEYTVLASRQETRRGVVLRALSRSQKSFDRPSP